MRGPSSRIHAAASRYCGTAGCTVPSARYGRRLTGLGYLWPWAWRFGQGQARSDREPLPAPVWLVPARAGVVEYEAQHRVARHSWANLNDLHHCHIFCIQVQARYPYSWPLRPEAKYRCGLPAPQHAWPGRGRPGRLGGWGVSRSRGCNRPCAPLVSGSSIAVCQDPGGQAERQDRSTEASTTQARSARTRSTQTGGSPGRGTAARRAALAPRRPGSWKASRELPRRTCTGRVPVAHGSVSRVLSPPGSGTVCSDAQAAIGAPPGQEWPGASPFRGNLHLGPGIRSAAIDACRCLHLGAVMHRQPYVSTTLTAAARTPTPPRCLPRQPLRPTRGPECSGISFMFSLPVARD